MLVALVLIVGVAATPTSSRAEPGPEWSPAATAPERYLDEAFAEVAVTENLLYRQTTDYQSQPIDLRLDLYQPVGDQALRRPLVVFMHGGWFAFGSKNGMGPIAETYARRGFVVAAIDYRVNPDNGHDDFDSIDEAMTDEVFLDSVFDADADARAAVRWLRDRAAALRVHPEAIVAAGHSAGAVLSLLLAYLPFSLQQPGSVHYGARVAAALPWSGAIQLGLIQAGEPPMHVSHGTADATIPFSFGEDLCTRASAVGTLCELLALPGVNHSLGSHRNQIVAAEAPFLLANVLEPLGLTTAVDPAEPPTFTDVPRDHPFFHEVECAVELGVAGGFPDGTYAPASGVTRQAMAAFLYRQAGRPPFAPTTPSFTDVGPTDPFFTEIEWAAAHGLTTGYDDGTFRPTATVTRQATAAFLCRSSLLGL
jgi:acetyl esterase/lipase